MENMLEWKKGFLQGSVGIMESRGLNNHQCHVEVYLRICEIILVSIAMNSCITPVSMSCSMFFSICLSIVTI